MQIKMVAIDLDDTLLTGDLKISPLCIQMIRQAQELGVMVTLATGRMYRSALPYARQIGTDIPLITYQGALVKSSNSETVSYFKPVPEQEAHEVMQYFKQQQVHFHTYIDDQLWLEKLTDEGQAYVDLAGVEPQIVGDLARAIEGRQPMKILAVSHNERLILEMEEELKTRFAGKLNIMRSKPYYLEAMHNQANKADALQILASNLGFKREEVMAVGDSYNDLDMLTWAGIGVAMGNSQDVVKQAADYVTLSNEEEGVAEALRKWVIEPRKH